MIRSLLEVFFKRQQASLLSQYIIWSIVFAIGIVYIAKWLRYRKAVAELKKFPSLSSNVFLGSLAWANKLYFKETPLPSPVYILERMMASCKLFQKNGVYLFWHMNTPIPTVFKAEHMEVILTSSTSLTKSEEYSYLHPWLGLGLLTSTGSKWKARRKILTPAFHFRILEDFLPVFNSVSMELVKKLNDFSGKEFIDISPLIVLCTLDVISESVMGVRINALENSESEYVKAVHNLGYDFNLRVIRPWLWKDAFFAISPTGRRFKRNVKILHDFTRKVIQDRREVLLQSKTSDSCKAEPVVKGSKFDNRKALMDLLLDLHINSKLLSEEDIREEVDTFMFEGHDTTAMGIIFSLYCIGLYSHVQEKVVEELDSIFGDDKLRPVAPDDLKGMKYMECVLKEVQRLYPSVPVVGRSLDEEIILAGRAIPKGTIIHGFIYALHRDSDEFPNPEIFDPDRFLPENASDRHPFSYIPFSAGPRNCIGQKFAMMEEKTFICNILRHFKVNSLDPSDQVHVKIEFVLRPAQPMRLAFIPR